VDQAVAKEGMRAVVLQSAPAASCSGHAVHEVEVNWATKQEITNKANDIRKPWKSVNALPPFFQSIANQFPAEHAMEILQGFADTCTAIYLFDPSVVRGTCIPIPFKEKRT
jgi:hypothetical protein